MARARRPGRRAPALPSLSARTADGLAIASTAVADPSPSERRSSPRRACIGPSAPPSRRWTKPRTARNASSNASHGLRSRHCVAAGSRTWPPATRREPPRPAAPTSRLDGSSAWSRERRSAARTLAARRSVSIRSMIAVSAMSWRGVCSSSSSSTSVGAPSTTGKRSMRPGPRRLEVGVGHRARHVVGFERRLALLGAAPLVAADRAAVVADDGLRRPVLLGGPGELVGDEHPPAGRAAGREQVADRHLEAGLPPGRRGHALERGVEVAHVRRTQHDLREHPGQRRRFDGDRAALTVERGASHPATPPGQVDDDVAGAGVRLDPGRQQRRRRGRREPLEGGQRIARFGARGGDTAGHAADDASPRPPAAATAGRQHDDALVVLRPT